jgi:hypothetical protein
MTGSPGGWGLRNWETSSSEDPDRTSMGPRAIQVRRAAEVLGYDPHNLTDMQRSVIVDAVKDPRRTSSSPPGTWPSSRPRAGSPTCRPSR